MKSMKLMNPWIFKGLTFATLMICVLAFTGCEQDDDLNIDDGTCLVEVDGEFENIPLDEAPVYLNGGSEGYLQAIYDNLKYPAEARENSIEGTCITTYEITINKIVCF